MTNFLLFFQAGVVLCVVAATDQQADRYGQQIAERLGWDYHYSEAVV